MKMAVRTYQHRGVEISCGELVDIAVSQDQTVRKDSSQSRCCSVELSAQSYNAIAEKSRTSSLYTRHIHPTIC